MKIITAQLFALRIPFVEAFAHSIRTRTYSDSIVVRVEAEDGTVGYGEAVARPYVTGETVESCLDYMATQIWPVVQQVNYPDPPDHSPPDKDKEGLDWLNSLSATLPSNPAEESAAVVAWNAARTGWELALVDCFLKSRGQTLGDILPPKRSSITYSGVITSSSTDAAVKMAKRFKQFGVSHLKVKITGADDHRRIAAIRDAVGAEPSIRLDGNGAYSIEGAIAACQDLAQFRIDSAEQMIPPGNPSALARVQASSPIPQMADESLITLADAQALIDANACQWFNLRISKCGGLAQTVAIAHQAEAAGIRLQLGCQVGETAILSAAGRHLAAYLPVEFVEGSYGKLLLSQDISRTPIQFGNRGHAPLLKRPGLGVDIQDTLLETYTHQHIPLTRTAPQPSPI